jgi:hypothetical protein
MKYIPLTFIIFVILLLSLTGCSTVANIYDGGDPCLQAFKQERPLPSWCGTNSTTHTIRDTNNHVIGTITTN